MGTKVGFAEFIHAAIGALGDDDAMRVTYTHYTIEGCQRCKELHYTIHE